MLPQNNPDRIRIVFDDHRLVANAGLLLPATLARHLVSRAPTSCTTGALHRWATGIAPHTLGPENTPAITEYADTTFRSQRGGPVGGILRPARDCLAVRAGPAERLDPRLPARAERRRSLRRGQARERVPYGRGPADAGRRPAGRHPHPGRGAAPRLASMGRQMDTGGPGRVKLPPVRAGGRRAPPACSVRESLTATGGPSGEWLTGKDSDGTSRRQSDQHDHGPAVGERSWPSPELLRNTPEFSREFTAGAGELDDPVSPPWRGLAVRLTRRPRQRGQHHAPTGIFLGYLDQEFPQRDIDVDIGEFEVEGGLHVGGADEARRGVVLASLLPQSFAFGEGHLDPAVAAGNGAFDRDFSGHFPNITTTAQGRGFRVCAQGEGLAWRHGQEAGLRRIC